MVDLTEGADVFIRILEGNVVINALAGDDVVEITNFDEGASDPADPGQVTVDGGSGDDELTVQYAEVAILYGRDGDDVLEFGWNSGVAYGGAGDDSIRLDGDEGTGYGEDGNDEISVGLYGGADGGNGDDILTGGHVNGANGSDFAWGYWGGDGGAGDDNVRGGDASGGDGSDVVGADEDVDGGAGNDVIVWGGSNNPEFEEYGAVGGSGRDVFFAFAGMLHDDGVFYIPFTVADFEPGVDAIAFTEQLQVVSAFTGQANQVVSTATEGSFDFNGDGVADHTSTNYRHLTQDDFLVIGFQGEDAWWVAEDETHAGTAAAEYLSGGAGDDTLAGNGGQDWVYGGFGSDTLNGNSGDDLLVGHAGNDKLYGGSGDDELDGGDGDDIASGSIGDDYAYGGAGDDLLAGGDGADRLLGEWDNDRLNGGAGNDMLDGGEGDDTLIGGAGKDWLTGGAGADKFLFMPGDSRPGGGVRDVVTDFTTGEDTLDLRALGVTDAAAQLSYQTIGNGIILHVDLDGDGRDASDFALQLTGVWSLAEGDMLL